MKQPIIVFCAHNDDHIIGAGGTLAKLSGRGSKVPVVVFAYGEATHPWLRKDVAIKMRVKESRKADRVLKNTRTFYLGLKEGSFEAEIREKKVLDRIRRFISIIRPKTILTHSPDDPHPDHRSVYHALSMVLESMEHRCDLYSFDVWNPFSIRHTNRPRLMVDISKTFARKVRAFNAHDSQWMAKLTMLPAMYIRAIANGMEIGVKYAEGFVKIR